MYSYSTGMNHGKKDGVILKLDSSGVMIWAKYYGGSNEDDFVYVNTDATNAFLVGNTNSPGLNVGISNLYSLKLDSTTGALLW